MAIQTLAAKRVDGLKKVKENQRKEKNNAQGQSSRRWIAQKHNEESTQQKHAIQNKAFTKHSIITHRDINH